MHIQSRATKILVKEKTYEESLDAMGIFSLENEV